MRLFLWALLTVFCVSEASSQSLSPGSRPKAGSLYESRIYAKTLQSSTIEVFGSSAGTTAEIACGQGNYSTCSAQLTNNLTVGNWQYATAFSGYGILNQAGGQVFGLFGRVDLNVAGTATNEFDSFNNSGAFSGSLPPASSFGTTDNIAIAAQVVPFGSFDSAIGLLVIGGTQKFYTGIYSAPNSSSTYGVFVDGTSTVGPTVGMRINTKTNGIPLQLKVVGTPVAGDAVLQVLNSSEVVVASIIENGSYNSNGTTVLTSTGANNYTQLFDGSGNATLILGGVNDQENYYRNSKHDIGSVAGGTRYMLIGPGVQIGAAPTGGDKGANTLNIQGAIYNNGTISTGTGGGYVLATAPTITTATLTDAINQETHEAAFTVTTTTTLANITGLSQSLTAAGKYSCNGHLHFTTAPTTSNGVKLALATSDTLTVTTLNFNAIGFNGAAFAATGTGTATALAATAVATTTAHTDIILNAQIVVNAAGTLQVQIAENASSGTIAGNARWDCHRAS